MKKYLFVYLIILLVVSCVDENNAGKNEKERIINKVTQTVSDEKENNEIVTLEMKIIDAVPVDEKDPNITKPVERMKSVKMPINTEQLILCVPHRSKLVKITGVENLINIKRLVLGYGIEDVAFLPNLSKVEVLIIDARYVGPENINKYLSFFPRLKILYTHSVLIQEPVIDFQSNKELIYVNLGVYLENTDHFYLDIKNIPVTLEYLNISDTLNLIITRNLLKSLSSINHVYIPEDNKIVDYEITEEQARQFPNVIIQKRKEDELPDKYTKEGIYGLFGITTQWDAVL